MRKLAPAQVSYRDDFLISYHFYVMTGSFHISLFEGTLHVDNLHVWFKIANIRHAQLVPVYWQTDFTPDRWTFHVYMILLRNVVPEWNSRPGVTTGVNSCWGDSCRHDILWLYHVNKCRVMGGNQRELAPARKSPQYNVNTPKDGFQEMDQAFLFWTFHPEERTTYQDYTSIFFFLEI